MRPWTAPARRLVLHHTGAGWRYAIYTDAGVIDGALPGPAGSPEQAQEALLAHATDVTGHRYAAAWSSQEHGWSATLDAAEAVEGEPGQ